MNNVDVALINHNFSLVFSNFCKCLAFIVSMFFSFFVIFLSITLDLETSLLSVSVEKTIQKIFRVETDFEKEFVFIAIVFDILIILLNEIAISDRNVKKKLRMSNILLRKKMRMMSNNNASMLFRRRCRLTIRN